MFKIQRSSQVDSTQESSNYSQNISDLWRNCYCTNGYSIDTRLQFTPCIPSQTLACQTNLQSDNDAINFVLHNVRFCPSVPIVIGTIQPYIGIVVTLTRTKWHHRSTPIIVDKIAIRNIQFVYSSLNYLRGNTCMQLMMHPRCSWCNCLRHKWISYTCTRLHFTSWIPSETLTYMYQS